MEVTSDKWLEECHDLFACLRRDVEELYSARTASGRRSSSPPRMRGLLKDGVVRMAALKCLLAKAHEETNTVSAFIHEDSAAKKPLSVALRMEAAAKEVESMEEKIADVQFTNAFIRKEVVTAHKVLAKRIGEAHDIVSAADMGPPKGKTQAVAMEVDSIQSADSQASTVTALSSSETAVVVEKKEENDAEFEEHVKDESVFAADFGDRQQMADTTREAHEQRMDHLRTELHSRRQMLSEISESRKRLAQMRSEVENKSKFVGSFRDEISRIRTLMKPMRQMLCLPSAMDAVTIVKDDFAQVAIVSERKTDETTAATKSKSDTQSTTKLLSAMEAMEKLTPRLYTIFRTFRLENHMNENEDWQLAFASTISSPKQKTADSSKTHGGSGKSALQITERISGKKRKLCELDETESNSGSNLQIDASAKRKKTSGMYPVGSVELEIRNADTQLCGDGRVWNCALFHPWHVVIRLKSPSLAVATANSALSSKRQRHGTESPTQHGIGIELEVRESCSEGLIAVFPLRSRDGGRKYQREDAHVFKYLLRGHSEVAVPKAWLQFESEKAKERKANDLKSNSSSSTKAKGSATAKAKASGSTKAKAKGGADKEKEKEKKEGKGPWQFAARQLFIPSWIQDSAALSNVWCDPSDRSLLLAANNEEKEDVGSSESKTAEVRHGSGDGFDEGKCVVKLGHIWAAFLQRTEDRVSVTTQIRTLLKDNKYMATGSGLLHWDAFVELLRSAIKDETRAEAKRRPKKRLPTLAALCCANCEKLQKCAIEKVEVAASATRCIAATTAVSQHSFNLKVALSCATLLVEVPIGYPKHLPLFKVRLPQSVDVRRAETQRKVERELDAQINSSVLSTAKQLIADGAFGQFGRYMFSFGVLKSQLLLYSALFEGQS